MVMYGDFTGFNGDLMGSYGDFMGFNGIYPLVNVIQQTIIVF